MPDENDDATFEEKVAHRMKEIEREDERERIEAEARRRLALDDHIKRVSGL